MRSDCGCSQGGATRADCHADRLALGLAVETLAPFDAEMGHGHDRSADLALDQEVLKLDHARDIHAQPGEILTVDAVRFFHSCAPAQGRRPFPDLPLLVIVRQ